MATAGRRRESLISFGRFDAASHGNYLDRRAGPEFPLSLENKFYRYLPPPVRKLWDRIRSSSLGYRLAHGAFWSMTGAGVSQAMMLLSSIVVARILGRQQFGEFGIINNTIGMFGIFAGFGLGMTATKYVA